MIDRPTTAPLGVLSIMISLFVSQLTLLVESPAALYGSKIADFAVVSLASIQIYIILNMPLRSPRLLSKEISPAYGIPTQELRSPEDNLTPWQYMTFSWMAPLISTGSARQLNEEDVWSLSYEFQHRFLHNNFRELKGSVVRRLLAANGLDLVIVSSIGIIDTLASMHISGLVMNIG